ncbi:MAG TPA: endolytic transglycosylase MltG [Herpetosiphonaceae bacterium]|nr:endolytic transglycosylase MltG [Herpetosiphonaceae bacterium]
MLVRRLVRALLIVITLGCLLVAGIFTLLLRELTVPVSDVNIAKTFVVAPKETLATISNNLQSEGLIRRAILFRWLTNSRDAAGKLQPGTYQFSPNMTMNQMLEAMQVSPEAQGITKLVLREGLRLEEIAAAVEATGVVSASDFLEVARNGEAFKANYDFLADLPAGASLEGFLFPDTYEIFTNATAEDLVAKLLDNFAVKYADVDPSPATSGRSAYEIVTMASIVQREAANTEEMPRIAAAFWNRLKPEFAGQQLGADPTVQYVLGTEGSWWPQLDELTIEQINNAISPYNTRINPGLPPGPISAPGLAALKASAAPADEDITYFVTKCVAEGEKPTHEFTNDYQEFLQFQDVLLTCQK